MNHQRWIHGMNPTHFRNDPADYTIKSRLIRKFGFEFRITFWPWQCMRSPSACVFIRLFLQIYDGSKAISYNLQC